MGDGKKAASTGQQRKAALLKLLDDNIKALQTDLEGLKGKDRATLIISLAKHCTPPAINPDKLTIEQLEQILQYIKDNEKK